MVLRRSNRAKFDREAQQAGNSALHVAAIKRAADFAPVIAEIKASGATSLRAIADGLNARNIPTMGGTGRWHSAQVARVLARMRASDSST
jgi:hypothetical protein